MAEEGQGRSIEEVESHISTKVVGQAPSHAPLGFGGPGHDAFLQQLAKMFRQFIGASQHVTTQPLVPAHTQAPTRPPIDKLRKYGANEFKGRKEDDSSVAEYWLDSTERVLQQLQCSPQDKLICAVSLLKEEAYHWWDTVARTIKAEQITWEFFISKFRKSYVGDLYMEDKKKEFLYLKQGKLTVSEYERDFIRLSRYAREMIPTEEARCKKFEQGLHTKIRKFLAANPIREFSALVNAALNIEKIIEEEQSKKQRSQQKRTQSQSQGEYSGFQGISKKQKGAQYSRQGQTQRQSQRPTQSTGSRFTQQTTLMACIGESERGLPPVCEHCSKRHAGACRKLIGACFRCGSIDHFMRDCPKGHATSTLVIERSTSVFQKSRGRGKSEPTGTAGQRMFETVDRPDSRTPVRTYASSQRGTRHSRCYSWAS